LSTPLPAAHPAPIDLLAWASAVRARVNGALEKRLADLDDTPSRLAEAMRYAVLGDGKRVRPLLAVAAFEAVGGVGDAVLPVAGALELIHAYSLVHDDLPAMDDDDTRRGRPTCHRAFDEATAVLVGDGLQALAFGWLVQSPLPDAARARLVAELAAAAGPAGMVGGQQADMEAEATGGDLDRLRYIHAHKTGALLTACVRMGAIAGGAGEATLGDLTAYGERVGLAFQVADDVLDVTADPALLGKAAGKDLARHKLTYPGLLGLAEARALGTRLKDEALARVAGLGPAAEPLRALAAYIVERTR
jgi:geranylgeranyl diphosphate synthase type II